MAEAPADLYEQVFHTIEGYDEVQRTIYLAGGETKKEVIKVFAPERWIERAEKRGVLTAKQFLAVVFFTLVDFGVEQDERRLVHGWHDAMLGAVQRGELIARDVDSLLPIMSSPQGLDWVMFASNADAFLKSVGMDWTCTEVVAHIYKEVFGSAGAESFLDGQVDEPTVPLRDEESNGRETREWDDYALRKLWDESLAPGVTQTSLARQYGVSRQRIGQLRDVAKAKFSSKKASFLGPLEIGKSKN